MKKKPISACPRSVALPGWLYTLRVGTWRGAGTPVLDVVNVHRVIILVDHPKSSASRRWGTPKKAFWTRRRVKSYSKLSQFFDREINILDIFGHTPMHFLDKEGKKSGLIPERWLEKMFWKLSPWTSARKVKHRKFEKYSRVIHHVVFCWRE